MIIKGKKMLKKARKKTCKSACIIKSESICGVRSSNLFLCKCGK